MNKQETILQSLKKIEYLIYKLQYEDLNEYLQGVRDIIELINGEKSNIDIASHILEQVAKQEIKHELQSKINIV